jgi:uncharacterized protein YjiS (DUF1127 family)
METEGKIMGTSAELQVRAPRETSAPASARGAPTKVIPLRQPSGSDRSPGTEVAARNAAPWRSSSVAVPTDDVIPSDWSSNYALYLAARAHRAFALGELAAVAVQAVADIVRATVKRYRRMRHAAAAREALHQLDDRTLHDLGIDRSEIASIAAEAAGAAEQSRAQVVRTPPNGGQR